MMRNVKEEQSERLEQIEKQIKALEEERVNIFDRSFHGPESEKVCEDWMAEMMTDLPVSNSPEARPVRRIVQGRGSALVGASVKNASGCFVKVRCCSDDKTYLGMLLGELALGVSVKYSREIEAIQVDFGFHNPAIWVFDLKRVVLGCESWWGVIESEDQLKEITDADINNVWYVRALQSIQDKAD